MMPMAISVTIRCLFRLSCRWKLSWPSLSSGIHRDCPIKHARKCCYSDMLFRFIDQVFINLIRNAYDIRTFAKISEFLHFFQCKYLAKRIIRVVDDNCFEFWTFQGIQFVEIDCPRFVWIIFVWFEFDKLGNSSSKLDHGEITVEEWFDNDDFITRIDNCLTDWVKRKICSIGDKDFIEWRNGFVE